ncbi:hypothetical protein [Streptomyces sp. NPDC014006]
MTWWGWALFLIALVLLLTVGAVALQARRRSGTVLVVRRERRPRRGGAR